MKKKTTITASLTIASLLFAVYQPGNAVTYYGHDGSIDEHMTKTVKPYAGKPNCGYILLKFVQRIVTYPLPL